MKEAERKYLDGVFGGDYHGNKYKKEYRHIDTWQNNQSGMAMAKRRKEQEKQQKAGRVIMESVQDLRSRGKITEQQAVRMRNAL